MCIGQREIIDYLRKKKKTTVDEICKHFKTNDRSKIINRLLQMRKHGYIPMTNFVHNRYEDVILNEVEAI